MLQRPIILNGFPTAKAFPVLIFLRLDRLSMQACHIVRFRRDSDTVNMSCADSCPGTKQDSRILVLIGSEKPDS